MLYYMYLHIYRIICFVCSTAFIERMLWLPNAHSDNDASKYDNVDDEYVHTRKRTTGTQTRTCSANVGCGQYRHTQTYCDWSVVVNMCVNVCVCVWCRCMADGFGIQHVHASVYLSSHVWTLFVCVSVWVRYAIRYVQYVDANSAVRHGRRQTEMRLSQTASVNRRRRGVLGGWIMHILTMKSWHRESRKIPMAMTTWGPT